MQCSILSLPNQADGCLLWDRSLKKGWLPSWLEGAGSFNDAMSRHILPSSYGKRSKPLPFTINTHLLRLIVVRYMGVRTGEEPDSNWTDAANRHHLDCKPLIACELAFQSSYSHVLMAATT